MVNYDVYLTVLLSDELCFSLEQQLDEHAHRVLQELGIVRRAHYRLTTGDNCMSAKTNSENKQALRERSKYDNQLQFKRITLNCMNGTKT